MKLRTPNELPAMRSGARRRVSIVRTIRVAVLVVLVAAGLALLIWWARGLLGQPVDGAIVATWPLSLDGLPRATNQFVCFCAEFLTAAHAPGEPPYVLKQSRPRAAPD